MSGQGRAVIAPRTKPELSALVAVLDAGREVALSSWRPSRGIAKSDANGNLLVDIDSGVDVYHCAELGWDNCGRPVGLADVKRVLRSVAASQGTTLLEFNDTEDRSREEVAGLFSEAAKRVRTWIELLQSGRPLTAGRRGSSAAGRRPHSVRAVGRDRELAGSPREGCGEPALERAATRHPHTGWRSPQAFDEVRSHAG
ncbi:Uncharacterised protein [Mycobacteroides abscessus subsp. bolletii]|uniref:hypothetical protein n=1 Tax=Mycobacteroides abscessus TaxID=36809 RepID=UPI0009C58FB9|nr:hypothetical protein [Mycobacteroides abscessus]SKU95433.1 Uncharacterised protein [Mycobacteroides abscessus subsp. bolletii]